MFSSTAFFLCICAFGLASGSSVEIEATTQYHDDVIADAVNIRCAAKMSRTCGGLLSMIQLYKGEDTSISTIQPDGSITSNRLVAHSIKAEGEISNDRDQGFLSVTINGFVLEDSGIYNCVMYYTDEFGFLRQETDGQNVTVRAQALQDVVRYLVQKTNALENLLQEFRHESLLNKMLDLETSMINQGTELEKQETEIMRHVTSMKSHIQSLNDKQLSNEAKMRELETKDNFTSVFSYGYNARDIIYTGHAVVFSEKLLDIGGHYNPQTGVFRAPKDGLYVFHLLVTLHATRHTNVDLRVNGVKVTSLHGRDDKYWAQSSTSSVVVLRAGDLVAPVAKKLFGGNTIGDEDHFSVFSGYLAKRL